MSCYFRVSLQAGVVCVLPFYVSQLQKTKSRTDDHCRDIGATSMALATHQQQTETDMEVRHAAE